jgi:2-dehydropantoate 2-reductase
MAEVDRGVTRSARQVAVVGGGAIGCVWAAFLGRAGHLVTVVDSAPAVVEAIASRGVIVEAATGERLTVPVQASDRPEAIGPVDFVFFFVKAHQTRAAAGRARPLVGRQTTVVTQQNGWGNADVLAEVVPPGQLVVGVTYHSALVVGPGHVRQTAAGPGYLGPFVDGGPLEPAAAVGEALSGAGIEVTVTAGVKTEIWKKLILNCATLPTAALTRLRSGQLGQPGPLRDLLDALAGEAVAVAQARGYAIDLTERRGRIHALLAGGGQGKASMLQDVEGGRKTEIEVINGAVVAAGEALGIEVPLNRAMVALVAGLERSYQSPQSPPGA